MRKLILSLFFLVTSICFAGEYELKWKMKGYGNESQFKIKIATSQYQQYITYEYPPGFSLTKLCYGAQNSFHDYSFLSNAKLPVIITPAARNTIQIEYNRIRVQAHSLLYLLVNALRTHQGEQGMVMSLEGMTIAFSLLPVSTLPDGSLLLEQSISGGIVVDKNIVYANLFLFGSYVPGSQEMGYGVILEQITGGFQITLTFGTIEPQTIQQILTSTYNGTFISGFIPNEIMDALITFPQESAPMVHLATQGIIAGVVTAATLKKK